MSIGQSTLDQLRTSGSQTLRAAFRYPWPILTATLLAAGLLIRIALYFPLAMFQLDADAVIAGLCAFRVADGMYPVFLPGGTRVGAASCYVTEAYFRLFGPGRVGLALTALTWGLLYLAFTLLLLNSTLGRKRAPLALLFAIVPSEQFLTVTYAPWGYGEIMASCAATLWLASLWRKRAAMWQPLCFGLSSGLGLWFSLQTFMIVLPAIAWVAIGRRRNFVKEAWAVIPGAFVGLIPFLLANVTGGFPSLTRNVYSQPASTLPEVWSNFVWLLTYLLPKLLFGDLSSLWSRGSILVVAFALIALGFVLAVRRGLQDPDQPYSLSDLTQLLALVFISCVLVFSFSEAGTIRGWTVRYIAPLYVVVPLFCAIGIEGLWRRGRPLAIASVAALLVVNLLWYPLPGTSLRRELTAQLDNDVRLRALLTERRVRMVYGNYLWVYDLNFDTREQIAGVPFYAPYDYYNYGARLAATSVRWAMLGGLGEVSGWIRGVGVRGTLTSVGDLWLFIPDRPAPNAARLLATLRALHA